MCTLIVMAAVLGTRFGGNKQVSAVDDDGNFNEDVENYFKTDDEYFLDNEILLLTY